MLVRDAPIERAHCHDDGNMQHEEKRSVAVAELRLVFKEMKKAQTAKIMLINSDRSPVKK